MSEENSEQQLEAIHKQAGEWFDDFIKSPHYETLTENQRDKAPDIVRFFAEYGYNYVGMAPADWSRRGGSECCVEVFPRKVSGELPFFQAVAPVLSAFFTFLGEKALLPDGRALAKTVAELDQEIVDASQDSRNWGPAKTFVMAAEKAGVNICDSQAMKRFMLEFNLRLLSQRPAQRLAQVFPPTASLAASTTPVRHSAPTPGRNEQCPCGSGKKFKKCCGR